MKRFLLLSLLFAGAALAQTVAPAPMAYEHQVAVSVGTADVTFHSGTARSTIRTPAGDFMIGANYQLVSRRSVTFCVSKNPGNSTSALVTVHVDGLASASPSYPDGGGMVLPDAGVTGPDSGTVLGWGDCVSFPVSGNYVPHLISNTPATLVTAFEGV